MSAVMEATTLRPVNPPQHTRANYSIQRRYRQQNDCSGTSRSRSGNDNHNEPYQVHQFTKCKLCLISFLNHQACISGDELVKYYYHAVNKYIHLHFQIEHSSLIGLIQNSETQLETFTKILHLTTVFKVLELYLTSCSSVFFCCKLYIEKIIQNNLYI